ELAIPGSVDRARSAAGVATVPAFRSAAALPVAALPRPDLAGRAGRLRSRAPLDASANGCCAAAAARTQFTHAFVGAAVLARGRRGRRAVENRSAAQRRE